MVFWGGSWGTSWGNSWKEAEVSGGAFESTAFDSASFQVVANADLAASEAQDTASIALEARHDISFALSEAQDTAAIALEARHEVSLAATESPDTASIVLEARHDLTLATTEPQDTLTADASVLDGLVLAAVEAADTAAGDASVYWAADLAATEAQDTADFTVVRNVPFAVESGVVTLQGNDARLATTRQLCADPAQYSLSGNVAILAHYRMLNTGSGDYNIAGATPRLYQSSFFYNDTEIVYVPQEIQDVQLVFEERTVFVPAGPTAERLAEYRESSGEARLRAS